MLWLICGCVKCSVSLTFQPLLDDLMTASAYWAEKVDQYIIMIIYICSRSVCAVHFQILYWYYRALSLWFCMLYFTSVHLLIHFLFLTKVNVYVCMVDWSKNANGHIHNIELSLVCCCCCFSDTVKLFAIYLALI